MTSLLANSRWIPDWILPEAGIKDAQFSPDGRRVLTVSASNILQMWNPQTREQVGKSMDPGGKPKLVEFSPTSKVILTASDESGVRIWNGDTGDRVAELLHSTRVHRVAFSVTGSHVVTLSSYEQPDEAGQVWETITGAPVGDPIRRRLDHSLHLSWHGEQLAAKTRTGIDECLLWDVRSGSSVRIPYESLWDSMAFDQAGDLIRVSFKSLEKHRRVENQSIKTEKQLGDYKLVSPNGNWVLLEEGDELNAVELSTSRKPRKMQLGKWMNPSFSADGTYLHLTAANGSLTFLNLATGEARPEASGLGWEDPKNLSFSGMFLRWGRPNTDGTRLLNAMGSSVYLWSTPPESWSAPRQPVGNVTVSSLGFDPAGHLLVGTGDRLSVRDAETGTELRQLQAVYEISANRRYAVTLSSPDFLQVRDVLTGALVGKGIGPLEAIRGTALRSDGRELVTISGTEDVNLWDIESSQHKKIPEKNGVRAAAFSPDGSYFLTVTGDGVVHRWQSGTGMGPIRQYAHRNAILTPSINTDGRHFLTFSGHPDFTFGGGVRLSAQLWNATSGDALTGGVTGGIQFSDGAFSKDGQRLVTIKGSSAQVRETSTGNALGRALLHDAEISRAEFSPNGERIVTTTVNGVLQVFETETGDPIGFPLQMNTPGLDKLSPRMPSRGVPTAGRS